MLYGVHKWLTNIVHKIDSSILYEQAGVMKLTKNQSHKNVTFVDGDDPYVEGYSTVADSTRKDQDYEIAPLSEFFARPVQIAKYSWGSIFPNTTFSPWQLFLTNPRVANRLTNFNLLRGTLKVKFVVNGNPFLYGRMMVGYTPYTPADSLTAYTIYPDLVQLSQLPHIFLNPSTSEGGILTCPFFYNQNYVSIPTSQFVDLGYITMMVMNEILHVSESDVNPANLAVYAWMEDIQLSVLTSVDQDTLIPQSGEIDQANATGVVSGPATTIARIANALGNIPYIAPYAKATELASNTVATIASRFGYCRPSITKSPDFVKVLQNSSFALTNTPDCSQKLSVDHKQESTVDPRISGINEDDMLSIVNIAKRESFLTAFQWGTEAASGVHLFNIRVTPIHWALDGQNGYHFPATAFASMPFRYWTGTMKIRFQIACSALHKGRLAIVWDPNFHGQASGLPPELNVMYSEIIDIAETTDFTMSISNGQPYTLIPNARPGVTALSTMYGTTKYSSAEFFSNGVLGVYVVNELTSPATLSDNPYVGVNVFISAGDDFKVFVPDDWFQHFVPTQPVAAALLAEEVLEEQSGTLIGTNTNTEDKPESPDEHKLFEHESADMTNLVYTGESITSFRAMLKRYALWNSLVTTTTAGAALFRLANFKFAIYPYQRGRYGNAPDTSTGGVKYAFCNTLLLHWVTYAFAGWRGNMRYKVFPRMSSSDAYWLSVQRFSSDGTGNEYESPVVFDQGSYTSRGSASRTSIRTGVYSHINDYSATGTNGMAWCNSIQSGPLEFEVPFYSLLRFAGGRHLGWLQSDTWNLGGFYLYVRGILANNQILDVYSSVGEDFQTYFYMGLPRMYYEPVPPPAI